MSTTLVRKEDVQRKWYVLDAAGKPLGRTAVIAANILRGKVKPDFTPNVDCGDNVIIVTADKVRLTGRKMTDRVYIRYTGYPGGQRFTTPKELLHKRPTELVRMSVKGMLPKNSLGAQMLKKLRVYVGAEHNHQAQQPIELKIED